MAAITLDIGGNTRQLDRDIQKTVNKVYNINLKTKGDQPLGRITGKVNEFNKSLDASNARVIAFGASAGIIFGVERAFTALVSATIEVQKSLQDINVILNASQANLQKFGAELFNIARNTGQSFQEVAKAATEFSRQGLGIEETLKRTNEALILSRLSGLDAAKSVESLTAAVNSFASQAVTATEVVNKFATVDAAFAVSSADLADAIARVGSSAAQSGVSLNELIAIVTSAQQTTARGGAVIGNSFKTIFTRLQREKVVDLLESLGISGTDASGQVKSTIQLLQDLGAVYDTLGSQQQAYVAEQVGGVFQINILKAALADLGKEYSIYSSALNVAAGATDQAIRRNEELNKTYAAQINALAENARQLAAAGGERLLGPSIDRLVGGTNTLLEGFSESDGQGVGAVLGKGILDGLGQFIAGPGLALIGGVLLKLFRDLAKFATGSVQQLLGLNTAATQQRDLQQSISQILAKNPQLLELALKGEQGLNTAANSLLASLQKQTVELQKQAAVAQQISKAFVAQAGVRVAGGVPVVPTGRSGKAAGYIPNFAKDDFAREELLATALGARNPTAQLSKGTIDGKKFIKNNREVEITNFGKNGDSAVIPNYAKGFIPNFQKGAQTPKEIVVAGAKKYGYLIPSTAPGRLSTPDKPIPGGTVTDTANNIKYIFPPQTAYGPKLIGEAEASNKLENQIYQSVLNRTASYTKRLAPPGKPVSPSDLEKGFQSAKGARGAILSAIGAAFEVGITTALGYESARSNVGAGDFDVRAGKGIEKIQNLFGIGGIVKADFKATTGGDSVTSFRKKILREEFGFGGAKKGTGPTGKQLKERGLTSGFRKKAFAGYIPNFAAIQDAVARERAAGIPSSQIYLAQEKALTSANPMGLGVFNKRDEPTKRSRKDAMSRKGFARGYIPNFAIEDPDVQAADAGTAIAAITAQLSGLAFAFAFNKDELKQTFEEIIQKNKEQGRVTGELTKAQKAANTRLVAMGKITGEEAKARGEAGRYGPTAGQKIVGFAKANTFGLATAAPILGETIKNVVGQETPGARKTGAVASAAGQIGSFAATGALIAPGPVGAGIGAAVGAILTIPALIDEFTTSMPELTAAAKKASQDLTKFGDVGQRLLVASAELSKLMGEGGSQEAISKAQDVYAKALSELSDVDRDRLSKAARVGKLEEEYAKVLQEKVEETAGTERFVKLQALEEKKTLGVFAGGFDANLETRQGRANAEILSNSFKSLFTTKNALPQELKDQVKSGKITEQQAIQQNFQRQKEAGLPNLQNLQNEIQGLLDKGLQPGPFSSVFKGFQNDFGNILEGIIPDSKTKAEDINQLLKLADDDIGAFSNVLKVLIQALSEGPEALKKALDAAQLDAAANEKRTAALKKAGAAIDATINSIQKNISVQNLLRATLDNTAESFRSLSSDLKISQKFTQPAETLESLIGTTAAPAMALRAQSDTEIIRAQERTGLATAGLDLKNEIRNILGKPFQENLNKIISKLQSESGALKGSPGEIIAQSDIYRTEASTEQKKLTEVIQNTEGLMRDFINKQITQEKLLDGIRTELKTVGIEAERGKEASNEIEMAVANYGAKSVNEFIKAFSQRAKLANETKKAILQAQIDQATKVFGGFEGFMNRPNEEQNYIEKIDKDINRVAEMRSSAPFRNTNRASVKEQERQAPELGRSIANIYRELLTQSGGAFRDFLQTEADTITGVSGSEGRSGRAGAGAVGGFQDVVRAREEDIKNELKLAKERLKTPEVMGDPVLKRTLEGFINSIQNIPGGTRGAAEVQTMKEFGVGNQKRFEEIYGKFQSNAMERLKQISPELAASLESALSVSDDPLMAEAQLQSGLQSEIVGFLGPIQSALLQMAKLSGSGSIEAYTPKLNEEQKARAEEFKTENAKIEARAKEIQDSATPKDKITTIGPAPSPDYQKYQELNKPGQTFKSFEDMLTNWAKRDAFLKTGKVPDLEVYSPQDRKTQPEIQQAPFVQQEAALNNNTTAINTLNEGIRNLNTAMSEKQNAEPVNSTPGRAGIITGTTPQVSTTTNAPVTVVVNAEGGGDIANAVAAAIQKAIPDIVNQVRLARGEKIPPSLPRQIPREVRGS